MKDYGAFRFIEKDATYYAEKCKLDVSCEIARQMKAQGMTKADLAKKLGTSPAYVTRLMRGDVNMSIETIAKLAFAVGCRFKLALTLNEAPTQAFKEG